MEVSHTSSTVQTLEGIYTFTVNGWQGVDTTVGTSIESPVFKLCENNWQLRIFPGGSLQAHSGYVSFYLANKDKQKVRVSYSLHAFGESFQSSAIRTFEGITEQVDGWGRDKFVLNTNQNSQNTLGTINVDFTVKIKRYLNLVGDVEPPKTPIKSVPILKICMSSMYNNREFSDIEIHIGERMFRAHKCILANCSKVFRAMLVDSGMIEANSGVITLGSNFDCEAFEEILRYIYVGSFSDNAIINDKFSELLEISMFFDIKNVTEYLEQFLINNISLFSIVDILVVMEKYDLKFVSYHMFNVANITESDKSLIENSEVLSEETKEKIRKKLINISSADLANNTVIPIKQNSSSISLSPAQCIIS